MCQSCVLGLCKQLLIKERKRLVKASPINRVGGTDCALRPLTLMPVGQSELFGELVEVEER